MQLNMRDWRIPALVGAGVGFAILSGGRLPFYLLYLSAGVLLVTYWWMRTVYRRLEGRIMFENERVEVGGQIRVKVRLDNDTVMPVPWMEVDDATPQHLVTTDLPHQATTMPIMGSRILTFKLTVQRRGHYAVGPIKVTMGDSLGLFEGARLFQSKETITVYPRVHHIEGLPVPLSQPFGPVRTRERAFEDPSNQAEIRKYRPGDNPRYIHWKTSARVGELMMREYELNAGTQMVIFPDLYALGQTGGTLIGEPSTVESTIEIAASLAGLGLRTKIDVGMVCHAQERYSVAAGRGERTFHEILEVLARLEARGTIPIEQVLEREAAHLSGRSTLVVVTPSLNARLTDTLIRLRSKHQVMLVLLDPESFSSTDDAEVAATAPEAPMTLSGLLSLRRVAVYLVRADDDLRRLADLRLSAANEGVRTWSPADRLTGIR